MQNLFYKHLGYGMSETTLLVGNFMGMKVKPGSMGKPGPGYKVDIIDDLGINQPLMDKTEIEICEKIVTIQ